MFPIQGNIVERITLMRLMNLASQLEVLTCKFWLGTMPATTWRGEARLADIPPIIFSFSPLFCLP